MEMIKGETKELRVRFYSDWTGVAATSTKANLTGATTKAIFKNRDTDADASAIFDIVATNVDAVNGLCKVIIPESNTKDLSQQKIWFDVVTTLADGTTVIRTEATEMVLKSNVRKTKP